MIGRGGKYTEAVRRTEAFLVVYRTLRNIFIPVRLYIFVNNSVQLLSLLYNVQLLLFCYGSFRYHNRTDHVNLGWRHAFIVTTIGSANSGVCSAIVSSLSVICFQFKFPLFVRFYSMTEQADPKILG